MAEFQTIPLLKAWHSKFHSDDIPVRLCRKLLNCWPYLQCADSTRACLTESTEELTQEPKSQPLSKTHSHIQWQKCTCGSQMLRGQHSRAPSCAANCNVLFWYFKTLTKFWVGCYNFVLRRVADVTEHSTAAVSVCTALTVVSMLGRADIHSNTFNGSRLKLKFYCISVCR